MLGAAGVIGGVVGGLLAAYWWDWDAKDLTICCPPHEDKSLLIWLYSAIGVVTGLLIGPFLVLVAGVAMDIRHRRMLRLGSA